MEVILLSSMGILPVFFPGKSYQERSLVGHSPWGLKRAGRNSISKGKLEIQLEGNQLESLKLSSSDLGKQNTQRVDDVGGFLVTEEEMMTCLICAYSHSESAHAGQFLRP